MKLKAYKSELTVAGIALLYAFDDELLEKWHILAPCTAIQAAEATLNVVKSTQNPQCFTVAYNGQIVGFFTLFGTGANLAAFYLLPAHRSNLSEALWVIINEQMRGPIRTCGLYHRNVRAHRWFERRGIHWEHSDGGGRYYTWSWEDTCHSLEPVLGD